VSPLLLEVASTRGHRWLGYARFDDFVREELGMAASRGRALLRLERLSLRCAVFAAAWRKGQLSWTQADVLARLFAEEPSQAFREAWILRASAVSVRRLTDDVDAALASGDLDPTSLPPLPAALEFTQDLQTRAPAKGPAETERVFFTAPQGVARLFRAVLASVQRALGGSEGEALDAMLEHVFVAWGRNRTIPKSYRLFARDGWRCTVPGCTSYRNLHGHHIRLRSRGGSDELANMTTLCAFHHLRGVHAGTVRCEGKAPSRLRFELGLRPGRRSLLRYEAGDLRIRAS